MSVEGKHTPLPWSVDKTDSDHGHILGQPNSFCSDIVGNLYDLDLPEGAANARLIVQAVNSYYELLGAAKILASLEEPQWMGAGRRTPTKDECASARAAIAKATMGEGGEG